MASMLNNVMSALHLGGKKEDSEPPPQPPPADELKELREKYEKAGQGHVFTYYDELKPEEKGTLYQQLLPIDPEHINEITGKPFP